MTKIQWTDETWNPVTGCTKVSAGCANCYAERLAPRVFAGQTVEEHGPDRRGGDPLDPESFERPRRFTDVHCHPERLEQPLRWRKHRMVFVNSMSDLFHEDVPDAFICRVFDIMRQCPQHTFQVLTKRPERMRDFARRLRFDSAGKGSTYLGMTAEDLSYPLMPHRGSTGMRNVWLGVSCEDQATADERIPILLETPAAVRFVSVEPLLGRVSLHRFSGGLDWVIVGGESGPKARPCDVVWVRSIVEQCKSAGVPCFVKQLGANVTFDVDITCGNYGRTKFPNVPEQGDLVVRDDGSLRVPLRDHKGGDSSEWPEDLRVREWPTKAMDE